MKKIIAAILVMVFCVVGICIVGPLCDSASSHSMDLLDRIAINTTFISGIVALAIFVIDFIGERR